MKRILVFILAILVFSCNPDLTDQSICILSKENIENEKYSEDLEKYLDCLVISCLKEKNRDNLLYDLEGEIMGEVINNGKKYSSQYISYKSLLRISDKQDFQMMMNSDKPSIRYYGFLGLAEMQNDNIFQELEKVIQDTSLVFGLFGCLGVEQTVADFCINEVIKSYTSQDSSFVSEVYQLSLEEKKRLDSLVLKSSLEIDYKKKLKLGKI